VGESLFALLVIVAWVIFNGFKIWGKITEASEEPYTPPSSTPALDELGQEEQPLDPTQREALLLQMAQGNFVRALQEARRRSRVQSADPETYDAGDQPESLEREPEVASLEEVVRRPGRGEYSQDAGAEQLVQRRINAAALRDTARSKADHIQFDERIRKEPADQTSTRGYTTKQLRDAIVWREILGPPVSER
jgi:hypothetical protein